MHAWCSTKSLSDSFWSRLIIGQSRWRYRRSHLCLSHDLSFIQVYDLAVIGLVLTLGRPGHLFGRKWIDILGFLVFIASAAFCGLAQTSGQLIAARVLQGIGGAIGIALSGAIMTYALSASRRHA